jgi:hypothetical protein
MKMRKEKVRRYGTPDIPDTSLCVLFNWHSKWRLKITMRGLVVAFAQTNPNQIHMTQASHCQNPQVHRLMYTSIPKRKVDFLFRPLSAVSVTNFLFGKTFTKQGSERKTIFTAHITKCLIRNGYLN